MALTERMTGAFNQTQPGVRALQLIGGRIMQTVRERIAKHGLFGELLAVMTVASSLKLLWSHEFPLGWWVILGILFLHEAVKEKVVWPREKYVASLEKERQNREIEMRKVMAKEAENAGNAATG